METKTTTVDYVLKDFQEIASETNSAYAAKARELVLRAIELQTYNFDLLDLFPPLISEAVTDIRVVDSVVSPSGFRAATDVPKELEQFLHLKTEHVWSKKEQYLHAKWLGALCFMNTSSAERSALDVTLVFDSPNYVRKKGSTKKKVVAPPKQVCAFNDGLFPLETVCVIKGEPKHAFWTQLGFVDHALAVSEIKTEQHPFGLFAVYSFPFFVLHLKERLVGSANQLTADAFLVFCAAVLVCSFHKPVVARVFATVAAAKTAGLLSARRFADFNFLLARAVPYLANEVHKEVLALFVQFQLDSLQTGQLEHANEFYVAFAHVAIVFHAKLADTNLFSSTVASLEAGLSVGPHAEITFSKFLSCDDSFLKGLLAAKVDFYFQLKKLEKQIQILLKENRLDRKCLLRIRKTVDEATPSQPGAGFILALLLLLTKVLSVSRPTATDNAHSEEFRRNSFCMNILQLLLERLACFLAAHNSVLVLLKRFVLHALARVFVQPDFFEVKLSAELLFTLLDRFLPVLRNEVGVLVQNSFRFLLLGNVLAKQQKLRYLEALENGFAKRPLLSRLFYHFDLKGWFLLEDFVNTLALFAENALYDHSLHESRVRALVLLNKLFRKVAVAGGTAAEFDSETVFDLTEYERLVDEALVRPQEKHTFRLDRNKSLANTVALERNLPTPVVSVPSDLPVATVRKSRVGKVSLRTRALSIFRNERGLFSRLNRKRTAEEKRAQRNKKALKLANTDSISKAVKFLRKKNSPVFTVADLARFLYEQPVDPESVGDFLGSEKSSVLSAKDHQLLREAFSNYIDLSCMDFFGAFRHFLQRCQFRLPKEGQKIDRLIELFAAVFLRDNPETLPNRDSCFVMAYAALMLNTSLGESMNNKNASVRPMTKEQFVANVQGTDDGVLVDAGLLASVYEEVVAEPITWHETVSVGTVAGLSEQQTLPSQSMHEQTETVLRMQTLIKQSSPKFVADVAVSSAREFAREVFELLWHRYLAVLNNLLFFHKSTGDTLDVFVLPCVEGLYAGATISCALGLASEYKTFLGSLARFTFSAEFHMELQLLEASGRADQTASTKLYQNFQRGVVSGKHLEQRWYRATVDAFLRTPLVLRLLTLVAAEIKERAVNTATLCELQRLQQQLDKALFLERDSLTQGEKPFRKLVLDVQLLKLSLRNNNQHTGRFLLFSDLFVYAVPKKKHLVLRVVCNLLLCDIRELSADSLFLKRLQRTDKKLKADPEHVLLFESARKRFLLYSPSSDLLAKVKTTFLAGQESRRAELRKFVASNPGTDRFVEYGDFFAKQLYLQTSNQTLTAKKSLSTQQDSHSTVRITTRGVERNYVVCPLTWFFGKSSAFHKCPLCSLLVHKGCFGLKISLKKAGLSETRNKALEKDKLLLGRLKVCDSCFYLIYVV